MEGEKGAVEELREVKGSLVTVGRAERVSRMVEGSMVG